MSDWHDYKGTLPEGTTHVQLTDGSVIQLAQFDPVMGLVCRYFGPALEANARALHRTDPAAPEPILPIPREAWYDTAEWCLEALLNGDLVTITHPEGYERCGLGVPFKRGQPTGGLTHPYRPIVILEWLAGQIPKRY